MLDIRGFDLWADGYDASVGLSDESNEYPFAGYKAVLGSIYRRIMERGGGRVLDVGLGTGTLSARLHAQGCELYGQDFSERMLDIARKRMPGAQLFCADFAAGLCTPLKKREYDFIVSTYALHHLDTAGKTALIRELYAQLVPGGTLFIGDIAFENAGELEKCRDFCGEEWDDDEYYFDCAEMQRIFPEMTFEKLSFCAGVLTLTKRI